MNLAFEVLRKHDVVVVQNVNVIALGQLQATVGIAHEPQVLFVAGIDDSGVTETADDLLRVIGRTVVADDQLKICVCLG
jgi:hypothetical protein